MIPRKSLLVRSLTYTCRTRPGRAGLLTQFDQHVLGTAAAYSTMARRSELVALTLEDVKFNSEAGDGIAIIRMTKVNREQAHQLAPEAVGHRSVRPQEVARIAEMPTFHRLKKGSRWHFFEPSQSG